MTFRDTANVCYNAADKEVSQQYTLPMKNHSHAWQEGEELSPSPVSQPTTNRTPGTGQSDGTSSVGIQHWARY